MMQETESSLQEGAPGSAAGGPRAIVCPACERLLPAGSTYCPSCCGEDGRRGALLRGAMFGWIAGFLFGGLASAAWSSYVGPEQTAWAPVLTTTLGCAVFGVLIGMIVNRKG
ncbi:hypothetical protein [Accumulibacter sp.]|uniref:hypothetical protein n=1 Tax=Accumulibacter sp. TaxID=2053492 RepID=UPI0025E4E0B2|nr:hypothetical protein [Accumulibacter sp.]MCM8596621.1 hypothetical protein [Accumulibacter sp.]MCM8627540.1 hypothetical protein [Accumulibacter sp.]MDS4050769.1 hypothetical protein [Accumulibacter sp.]